MVKRVRCNQGIRLTGIRLVKDGYVDMDGARYGATKAFTLQAFALLKKDGYKDGYVDMWIWMVRDNDNDGV